MHNVLRGGIVSIVMLTVLLFPATSFAEPAPAQKDTDKASLTVPPEPLTIAPEPKNYDIIGTIAVPAAVFTITVDGEEITTLEGDDGQPVIAAEQAEDGSYAWGYAIPERFAAGEHQIIVSAVVHDEVGDITRSFKEVKATLLLVVPPVVPPITNPPGETPGDATTIPVVPIVTTPLPLAPEIGQFVAPAIGDTTVSGNKPTIKKTELYGVPVSDLVPDVVIPGSVEASKASNDNRLAAASYTPPVIDQGVTSSHTSAAPIEATKHGWQIFGVTWYWVVIACLLLCIGIGLIVRAIAPRARLVAASAWTTLRV